MKGLLLSAGALVTAVSTAAKVTCESEIQGWVAAASRQENLTTVRSPPLHQPDIHMLEQACSGPQKCPLLSTRQLRLLP